MLKDLLVIFEVLILLDNGDEGILVGVGGEVELVEL